jgi:hypothetical protein
MQDPIPKITKAKGAGGIAQAVECLPCKVQEPEFSPSSSTKNRQKKERKFLYS